MVDTKVISCFSYKGGAGRSTLALNTVPFLAKKLGATPEHPLVLVDMDVDSCGLSFLFKAAKNQEYYVQNLFKPTSDVHIPGDNRPPASTHPFFSNLPKIGKYFCNVDKGYEFDDAAILLLPARPNCYMGNMDNLNAPSHKMKKFVETCCDVECCGILFDSAVGNQLVAGWSNTYSDYIICCMRPTKQFREGTDSFFDDFDLKNHGRTIIVVPNVVPTDPLTIRDIFDDDDEKRVYPEYARSEILDLFEDNLAQKKNEYRLDLTDEISLEIDGERKTTFGVPKIDRFMWQEGILNATPASELNAYEKAALSQYEKIADIIAED